MSRPRRSARAAALAVAAIAAAALLAPAAATGSASATDAADTPTTTPIKHFIYLMQENHSFDNYFGTYPGANGLPDGACVPVRVDRPNGECVKPYWLGGEPISDLGHTATVFRAQLNSGRNDGFIEAFADEGDPTRQAMGYYDDRDIPYYWNVADQYVLFDRFFTSAGGGSVWNHMYWVAGVAGNPVGDSIPVDGFGDIPTIFDRLEAKGVSWKFYVQNYDPRVTYRTYRTVDDANKGAQVVWAPVLAYARFLDDPKLFGRIAPLEEYYRDLAEGTLPAVSFMVPSGASEHPPGSVAAGERFLRTLHTALMRSSAWSTSAFLWTYDDWGGWYDHVVPPQVDEFGYGYRAPALLVSPYARQGHVDSTTLDFTSGLKFIENNWGVDPLAERDRKANDITSAFDFASPPREPVLLSDTRGSRETFVSRQPDIYRAYGAGVLVPAAVILLGVLLTRGRRRDTW
ncbi:phospholipase C [Oryzobacter telluris]|uniref:phospholipase C n=1 Tax=Oryzobacter telluris TaxID=3149179 RepID=UPI00370D89CF